MSENKVILMFLHGKMIYIGNLYIKQQDKIEEEETQQGTRRTIDERPIGWVKNLYGRPYGSRLPVEHVEVMEAYLDKAFKYSRRPTGFL